MKDAGTPGSAAPCALSRMERLALQAVWTQGDASRAAGSLNVSVHTVRAHLRSARVKLGVQTTLEAIRLMKEGR
jgi:DNA-binding NarL/FixJ family response regulator